MLPYGDVSPSLCVYLFFFGSSLSGFLDTFSMKGRVIFILLNTMPLESRMIPGTVLIC